MFSLGRNYEGILSKLIVVDVVNCYQMERFANY